MIDPPVIKDPVQSRSKLYQGLVADGLYTKSEAEFNEQFANPVSRKKLYEGLVLSNSYTKSPEEFDEQFFGDLKKKDSTTGLGDSGEPSAPPGPLDAAWAASQPLVKPVNPLDIPTDDLGLPRAPDVFQLTPDQKAALAAAVAPKPVDQFQQDFQTTQERGLRERLVEGKKPDTFTPIPTVGEVIDKGSEVATAFNKPFVEMVSSLPKSAAIVRKGIDELIYGNSKPIQAYDAYKFGDWIDEKAKDIGMLTLEGKGFMDSTIPAAFGSALSIMMTGGTMGGSPALGQSLIQQHGTKAAVKEFGQFLTSRPALAGGNVMGVHEFEAAKAAGATDQQAIEVWVKNNAVGTTEAWPLARALNRINEYTGGTLAQVIKAGFKGGFDESAQEAVQQYFTNKIAQGTYDPKRDISADLVESMGAGFFVGFFLPGLFRAMEAMTPEQRKATEFELGKILSQKGFGQVPFAGTAQGKTASDLSAGLEGGPIAPVGDLGKPQPNGQPQTAQVQGPPPDGGTPPVPPAGGGVSVNVPENVPAAQAPPPGQAPKTGVGEPQSEESKEIQKRMRPHVEEMVDVEDQFKTAGYDIDGEYDGEVIVTDSEGEIVMPEALPENLRELAGQYETANKKLSEFSEQDFVRVKQEVRKGRETTVEVVEAPPKRVDRTPDDITRIMNLRVPKTGSGQKINVKVIQDGKETTMELDAAVAIADFKNRAGLKRDRQGVSPMDKLIDCLRAK